MVEISMNVSGSGMMWCGYAFLFSLPAQYWPFTNTDYHVDGRNLQLWPPCLALLQHLFCTSCYISSQLYSSDRKRKCLWTEILKMCELYYLIRSNKYYFPLTLISCGVKILLLWNNWQTSCWVQQDGEFISDALAASDVAYWKLRKKQLLTTNDDRKNTFLKNEDLELSNKIYN